MPESTELRAVEELDYEEIEAAVMETTRGRWFLTEFAKRNKAADTTLLLNAIRRLEDQMLEMPAVTRASVDIGKLAAEAAREMQDMSGTGENATNQGNAKSLATRLASITNNLRSALDQPDAAMASAILPELDRLDTCTTEQNALADKLSKTAGMMRRIRESQTLDDNGLCAPVEPQLAQPEEPAPQEKPAEENQLPLTKEKTGIVMNRPAPDFVASDDDIFDDSAKPASSEPTPPQTDYSKTNEDTLNFSNIEVPPIPMPGDTTDNEPRQELPEAKPLTAEPQAKPEASEETSAPSERTISVTRRPSPDTTPASEPMTGRLRMSQPAANTSLNQATATAAAPAEAPAPSPTTSQPNASGSGSKKRIIVIRRSADDDGGIPLGGSTSPDGPSAA